MKTMGKITFQDVKAQSVLDAEIMRSIRGGVTPTKGATCGLNMWKNGARVKCQRNMTKAQALEQVAAFEHDADANTFYDSVYWCCDSCDPC